MLNNLYINTIRICIKAKKISFGETMLYDIRSGKAKVVVIATNAGEASSKKVMDKCNSSLAIGKKGQNVKLASRLTKYKIAIKKAGELVEE